MSIKPFSRGARAARSSIRLENGSRVAVLGGGLAGSFFGYFLLDLAGRVGIDISVDIHEPRDFSLTASHGCNHCAGVISESLVQILALDGITLPPDIVQRAIDSYIMHTDVGSLRIETPSLERRIGAVFRGTGPRGHKEFNWNGFDGYLLSMARNKGAQTIKDRITHVQRVDGKLSIQSKTRPAQLEYLLGADMNEKYLGSSQHVFLLDIPRLDFAIIVSKGIVVTFAILGIDIDEALLQSFLTAPEVKRCFPPDWRWNQPVCGCFPRITVRGTAWPYADRVVFSGDGGVSRLYKDGIGAAYRAAKAAAVASIFVGISAGDFERRYYPACRTIETDISFGRVIFAVTHLIQRLCFSRKVLLRMTSLEQKSRAGSSSMSSVLWDTFTGSAPYREIFFRTLHLA